MSYNSRIFLKVLSGPTEQINQLYELQHDILTMGREAGNDIILIENGVSRFHCNLVQYDDGYVIEDLGSTNGTYLNDVKVIQPQPIAEGDIIRLGKNVVMRIIVSDEGIVGMSVNPVSSALDKTIIDTGGLFDDTSDLDGGYDYDE